MPRRLHITDIEIKNALKAAEGIRSRAAHLLRISPRTLARRLASNPALALSEEDSETREFFGVVKALYEAAINGNVYAAIQFLKWRGWDREVGTLRPVTDKFLPPGSITLVIEPSPVETGGPDDALEQKRRSRS